MPQPRALVWITRQAVVDQLDLLLGSVFKGKKAGVRINQALDGIVVIQIHLHLAKDAQILRGLCKCQKHDGIAVDVAHPPYCGRRLNVETAAHDMNVVTFARPHHQAVWSEFDWRIVSVSRLVNDLDALLHYGISVTTRCSSPILLGALL